ncbi:hypothetical protein C0992_007377, partial [Termitomyces sp. T32_za158]
MAIQQHLPVKHHHSSDSLLPTYANERLKRNASTRWKLILAGLVTISVWFALSSKLGHKKISSGTEWHRAGYLNPAYLIEAEHGAVASENKRCSDVGVQILQDGGNAVDAAIGSTFCAGVVNMFS